MVPPTAATAIAFVLAQARSADQSFPPPASSTTARCTSARDPTASPLPSTSAPLASAPRAQPSVPPLPSMIPVSARALDRSVVRLSIHRVSTRWVRYTLVQARARSLRSRQGANPCLAQAGRPPASLLQTPIASVRSLARSVALHSLQCAS
ncbi:hypothetical protein F5H01DRAFT_353421 [Linnemannia elongata]|nr:hypothetical protein F5H01DRAFT_353421 [Linnemannia elongata]